ncbi:hypothetical protein HDU76_003600 [Blyttiomyces sp. JEL0837]|nr:hypothetical protein HDU76_003600 [Blyttiomyces sp. JEL0837]
MANVAASNNNDHIGSSIHRLPPEVISLLRSSLFTNSLSQVAVELLQNSIDAQASHVEIIVNILEKSLEVRDDGVGIPPDDFPLLGKRYATSKPQHGASSFGFRGEALASIGEVSSLQITSKSGSHLQTYTTIIKGGNLLHYGPATHPRRPGTTIQIKDFFYNFPVRQRKALSEESVESIRKAIEPVILISPHVGITVIDGSGGDRILSLKKGNTSISLFKQLYGRAVGQDLEEIHSVESDQTLDGFLSSMWFPSKYSSDGKIANASFYPDVNKHLLSSTNNPIHKLDISHLLAIPGMSPWKKRPTIKIGDTFPLFFLNISCPPGTFDITLDPEKNTVAFADWDSVLTMVAKTVNSFLMRHGLLKENPHMSINPSVVSRVVYDDEVFESAGDRGAAELGDEDTVIDTYPAGLGRSGKRRRSDGDDDSERYRDAEEDYEGTGHADERGNPRRRFDDGNERPEKAMDTNAVVRGDARDVPVQNVNGNTGGVTETRTLGLARVPLSFERLTKARCGADRPAPWDDDDDGNPAVSNMARTMDVTADSRNGFREGDDRVAAVERLSERVVEIGYNDVMLEGSIEGSGGNISQQRLTQDHGGRYDDGDGGVIIDQGELSGDNSRKMRDEKVGSSREKLPPRFCTVDLETGNSKLMPPVRLTKRLLNQDQTASTGARSNAWAENMIAKWKNPVFETITKTALGVGQSNFAGLIGLDNGTGGSGSKPVSRNTVKNVNDRSGSGGGSNIQDRQQRQLQQRFGGDDDCCDGMVGVGGGGKGTENTSFGEIQRAFGIGTVGPPVAETITKDDLKSFEVIGQADRKFIACSIKRDNVSTGIVIIDQHAADERVRLELLTDELFSMGGGSKDRDYEDEDEEVDVGGKGKKGKEKEKEQEKEPKRIRQTVMLDPPVRIPMTWREAKAVTGRFKGVFLRWGIGFEDCKGILVRLMKKHEQAEKAAQVPRRSAFDSHATTTMVASTTTANPFDELDNEGENVDVGVVMLPRLIADRCIADSSLVRGIVLEHLHRLEESPGPHDCPKGILHVLNSKACRSAIMFGDELDRSQCETLINNLKRCRFPFQCAHGRPRKSKNAANTAAATPSPSSSPLPGSPSPSPSPLPNYLTAIPASLPVSYSGQQQQTPYATPPGTPPRIGDVLNGGKEKGSRLKNGGDGTNSSKSSSPKPTTTATNEDGIKDDDPLVFSLYKQPTTTTPKVIPPELGDVPVGELFVAEPVALDDLGDGMDGLISAMDKYIQKSRVSRKLAGWEVDDDDVGAKSQNISSAGIGPSASGSAGIKMSKSGTNGRSTNGKPGTSGNGGNGSLNPPGTPPLGKNSITMSRQQSHHKPLLVDVGGGNWKEDADARPQEIHIRKVTVQIQIENSSNVKTLVVTNLMTADQVIAELIKKHGVPDDPSWSIFEVCPDFGIEKPLRDWELLTDILNSWDTALNKNAFVLRKYGHRSTLVTLSIVGTFPKMQGYLYLEVKPGKWQKRFCVLKKDCIFYQKMFGVGGEVQLCRLNNFDVYPLINSQSRKNTPTPYGFAIRSTQPRVIFEKEDDYINYMCVDKEDKLDDWVLALRLAKSEATFIENPEIFKDYDYIPAREKAPHEKDKLKSSFAMPGKKTKSAPQLAAPTEPVIPADSLLGKKAAEAAAKEDSTPVNSPHASLSRDPSRHGGTPTSTMNRTAKSPLPDHQATTPAHSETAPLSSMRGMTASSPNLSGNTGGTPTSATTNGTGSSPVAMQRNATTSKSRPSTNNNTASSGPLLTFPNSTSPHRHPPAPTPTATSKSPVPTASTSHEPTENARDRELRLERERKEVMDRQWEREQQAAERFFQGARSNAAAVVANVVGNPDVIRTRSGSGSGSGAVARSNSTSKSGSGSQKKSRGSKQRSGHTTGTGHEDDDDDDDDAQPLGVIVAAAAVGTGTTGRSTPVSPSPIPQGIALSGSRSKSHSAHLTTESNNLAAVSQLRRADSDRRLSPHPHRQLHHSSSMNVVGKHNGSSSSPPQSTNPSPSPSPDPMMMLAAKRDRSQSGSKLPPNVAGVAGGVGSSNSMPRPYPHPHAHADLQRHASHGGGSSLHKSSSGPILKSGSTAATARVSGSGLSKPLVDSSSRGGPKKDKSIKKPTSGGPLLDLSDVLNCKVCGCSEFKSLGTTREGFCSNW